MVGNLEGATFTLADNRPGAAAMMDARRLFRQLVFDAPIKSS
ncbi:hypothetical protein [Paracoccus salsus]|nr:hypothetical protein [Paracoccus salsus]